MRPLALALLRAVFDVGPVFGPLLAPLKGQAAALTNLGLKPILGLGYRHVSKPNWGAEALPHR